MGVCAGEYVVAEKLVTEDDEEKGLALGPLSSGSLHSMGTHDSSSSLDWTLDNAAAAKVPPPLHCSSRVSCMSCHCLLVPQCSRWVMPACSRACPSD